MGNTWPPTERAPVDKLFLWNTSGIQILDALDWLNLHKHVLEYAEHLQKTFKEGFK